MHFSFGPLSDRAKASRMKKKRTYFVKVYSRNENCNFILAPRDYSSIYRIPVATQNVVGSFLACNINDDALFFS